MMFRIFMWCSVFIPKLAFAQIPDSMEVVKRIDSLLSVAGRFAQANDSVKAMEVQVLAANLATEKFGKESPAYGKCFNGLASIQRSLRQFDASEASYHEALRIFEKCLGRTHASVASALNNLALLYAEWGFPEKAEPLFLEALTIREKVLGKESLYYTVSLVNLAKHYKNMGLFEKSEQFHLQALEIRKKIFGTESEHYATSLNELGILYSTMGLFAKAEPLLSNAIDIRKKLFGELNLDYANSLNNLAILYMYIGAYQKSEQLFLKVKWIREQKYGTLHPEYAAILNNLAVLYKNMGRWDKVEAMYLEAKSIWEKVYGTQHLYYALSLFNLGTLYSDAGNFSKAEPLLIEANSIYCKVLGSDHPDVANGLNNLASMYRAMGNYHIADSLYKKATQIWEKTLGKDHPNYAGGLLNLALLYSEMGFSQKSDTVWTELTERTQALIAKSVYHLSEKELYDYLKIFNERQDYFLSHIYASPTRMGCQSSFDHCLFYKGFLLHTVHQIRRLAGQDISSSEIFSLLKSYGRRLSVEYSKPIIERDSAKIADLEEKYRSQEKLLAKAISGLDKVMGKITWKDVQAQLKSKEAAIEFIDFRVKRKNQSDSTIYAALVLLRNSPSPSFIPLFEKRSLDSLLKVGGQRKADYVNELYTNKHRGAQIIGMPSRSLYELIWKPLEKELAGVQTIYYSPSGLLHRLNLAAVPVNDEQTLADRFRLICVNSTRQLANTVQIKVQGNEAVLYGGLQYDEDSTSHSNQVVFASRSFDELSFTMTDSALRGENWNYLPGTDKEIKAISQVMKSSKLDAIQKTGLEGTEESFKKLSERKIAPRILHIATHGYFFPDWTDLNKTRVTHDTATSEVSNNQKGSNEASWKETSQESIFKLSEHPMLRSGLILSEGNAGWQGKRSLDAGEDGVLTAYEISQMNLSNTELVVLSACETGLGDIQGNEGVYGLQRAFKIAGVKYIIMSLWQVPDKQTSMLMTTFYRKWLEEKLSIPDAFHAAQKELRYAGFDPYQWAGFVLVE